jgi:hypothetical protein
MERRSVEFLHSFGNSACIEILNNFRNNTFVRILFPDQRRNAIPKIGTSCPGRGLGDLLDKLPGVADARKSAIGVNPSTPCLAWGRTLILKLDMHGGRTWETTQRIRKQTRRERSRPEGSFFTNRQNPRLGDPSCRIALSATPLAASCCSALPNKTSTSGSP